MIMDVTTVHYLEPNDLPFNNEDLCIGVRLEVDVPGRPLSGSNDGSSTGTTVGSWTTIIDNVDLFGNKDGDYMTTSYSDISSLDPHNGGNMDSIGIEYINIRYNTWYFPEVDIKFIDLRGNALMNPMEARRDDRNKKGSFLNALFSFPYPIFKLTVKGYYGKPVTYKLTVRDARSNFNSATGNFEFVVKFIGYMFGYLNDIPMQYLLIAPHINYGGESSDLGRFHFNKEITGESTIPTFLDFMGKITNAIKNSSQNKGLTVSKNVGKNISECKKLINELDGAIESLHSNMETSGVYECTTFEKKYTLKRKTVDASGNTVVDSNVETMYKQLCLGKENIQNAYILYNQNEFAVAHPLSELDINTKNFESENIQSEVTLVWDYDKDKKKVREISKAIAVEEENNTKAINNRIIDIFTNELGWDPTIGNVIEMVLAHLDKFYKNMERCMTNIDGHRMNRKLTEIHYDTDCREHGNGELTVPPFPMLTSDKKYIWIGDADSPQLSNYDERDFVEHVVKGATSYAEGAADVLADFDSSTKWSGFPQGGIPSLLIDLYEGGSDNVFYNGAPLEADGGKIPEALKIFAKRLALRYIFNQGEDTALSLKTFAEVEALNLFMCNSQSSKRKIFQDSPVWNTDHATEKVREYLENYFASYNSKNTYSIDYKVYHNDDKDTIKTGLGKKTLTSNGTFNAWSSDCSQLEINGYDMRMDNVMGWINSKNGNLDGYSNVFPQTIQRKYGYFNDDVKRGGSMYKNRGFFLKHKNDDGKYINHDKWDINPKESDIWMYGNTGSNVRTIREFIENLNFDNVQSFTPCLPMYDSTDGRKGSVDIVSWIKKQKTLNRETLLDRFFFQLGMYNISDTNEDSDINGFNNINEKNKIRINDIQYQGIFKMPKLFFAFFGRLGEKFGTNNTFGSLEKIFRGKDSTYESVAKELENRILRIVELCNEEELVKDDTNAYYGSEFYNLPKAAKDILKQIFQEDVVIFNLHGKKNSVFNTKGGSNGEKEKVCSNCILGMSVIGDSENKENTENAVKHFIDKIKSLCGEIENTESTVLRNGETYASRDKKLATYMTLKELYDRWKFGAIRSAGNSGSAQNYKVDINNFVFYDSHYSDIKKSYVVNPEELSKLIRKIMDGSSEMSVYSFIYEICKFSNITLCALPVNTYEYLSSLEKMKEVFTPYPYMAVDDSAMATTYIGVYSHKPSEHLNNTAAYNGYDDDGVDFLMQTNDFVRKYDDDDNRNDVPVFGVTYGLSTQRFFKDISVGMDNPKATAHSLMSELLISQQGNSGANALGFEAHDIFDVYATKSYTCKVEMMGNVQIMPMTYFQLNNIPLFKGGYFIIHVEHNITKNGMTTSFEGVRINKNRFELDSKKDANITSLKSTNVDSQIGDHGEIEVYSTISNNSVPVATSIPYNKYDTTIMIDAGHDMKTSGKQSPNIDVADVWGGTEEFTPDLDADGTMRAKKTDGSRAFVDGLGINGEGTGRYREYWGNRKIADALKKELESRGYPDVRIVSSKGVDAGSITNFSSIVNNIYREKDGNCILISIHSNAAGNGEVMNDANYWSVYRQSREYISYSNTYKEAPHVDVSTVLAQCIGSAAARNFGELSFKQYNEIGNVRVYSEPKVFSESYKGIRPTTHSFAPTVLTENVFHTNTKGVRFLGSKGGAAFFAKLHADGIDDFFMKMSPKVYSEPVPADETTNEEKWGFGKFFTSFFK